MNCQLCFSSVSVPHLSNGSSYTEFKQLLKFCTGGEMKPARGVVFVEVSPDNDSTNTSTCLCEVVFPKNMANLTYEQFKSTFSLLIESNSFNCV